jgi:biotin carboxyl carrier protein
MDKNELYRLLEWFENSGLTELAVEESGWKAAMKKEPPGREGAPETNPPPAPPPPPAGGEPEPGMIASPMVGVFYRSPAADAPPFVEVGSRVERGDPLCILEAMKVMNTLEAEFGGEVIEVLAENGSLVEYGTPLFKVRRDDQVPADR